ncbi:ubiquitin-related domain-containing protein, partial [Leptodontidium sp. 2 PMI_412]
MSPNESLTEDAYSQITFQVKICNDGNVRNITIAKTATVLELKIQLAGSNYENLPMDRQRLIYSGRLMKDSECLNLYNIKPGSTIYM